MLQGPAVEEEDVPRPPKRLENWSRSPEATPTNSFSDRRRSFASSIRAASSRMAGPPPGTSPACRRKSASEACKLAELERPAPRGTSPAIAASNPDARGPWASCKAQTTPRT